MHFLYFWYPWFLYICLQCWVCLLSILSFIFEWEYFILLLHRAIGSIHDLVEVRRLNLGRNLFRLMYQSWRSLTDVLCEKSLLYLIENLFNLYHFRTVKWKVHNYIFKIGKILFENLDVWVDTLLIIEAIMLFSSWTLLVKALPISLKKILKDLAFIVDFFTHSNQLLLFEVPKLGFIIFSHFSLKEKSYFQSVASCILVLWINQMYFHQCWLWVFLLVMML